jgi:hypothetical protein
MAKNSQSKIRRNWVETMIIKQGDRIQINSYVRDNKKPSYGYFQQFSTRGSGMNPCVVYTTDNREIKACDIDLVKTLPDSIN